MKNQAAWRGEASIAAWLAAASKSGEIAGARRK